MSEICITAKELSEKLLTHPCGGHGICHGCRIRFADLSEAPEATAEERKAFSSEELSAGWRLHCLHEKQLKPSMHLFIPKEEMLSKEEVPEDQAFPQGQTLDAGMLTETDVSAVHSDLSSGKDGYAVAVDLGTTTVVMQLLDLSSGKAVLTIARQNPQTSFGSDVMNRIAAAEKKDAARKMKNDIRSLLAQGVKTFQTTLSEGKKSAGDKPAGEISSIVLAGNTTMIHLLLGWPLDSLGTAPYRAYSLSLQTDVIGGVETLIFPGISAFVGGDIVSGLYHLKNRLSAEAGRRFFCEKNILFLDLGTNAEMALFSGEKMLAASVAAGPAFEGGNLSCGMPALPGAICHVSIGDCGFLSIQTVGHETPKGVCGSGLMEAVDAFLTHAIIDRHGTYHPDYAADGYPLFILTQKNRIVLTQADIRMFQLAKAAIRAGMDSLLQHSGLLPDDLDAIYLAGAFGLSLDPDCAVRLGLFPPGTASRVHALGNTSLAGAADLLLSENPLRDLSEMTAMCSRFETLSLSSDEDFTADFVAQMDFPPA